MRTLKLTLAYDGTPFVGWQRQAAGASIQGLIEEALARLEGAPVTVVGAGRTDAGVHATGQVASVALACRREVATIRRALNATLPPEVRALAVEEAPAGFHARYDARAKTYRYAVATGEVVCPFLQRYAWHLPLPLDVAAMDRAARLVEGRHDFAAFQSAGSDPRTTGRTIFRSSCRRVAVRWPWPGPGGPDAPEETVDDAAPGELIMYEIRGDGFLRHMVRAIVGTLVEIGSGRRGEGAMAAILDARDRGRAGPTAPASGLVLTRVEFG